MLFFVNLEWCEYLLKLWYVTDVPPLWLEQIFTSFQVNKKHFTINNSEMQLFQVMVATIVIQPQGWYISDVPQFEPLI